MRPAFPRFCLLSPTPPPVSPSVPRHVGLAVVPGSAFEVPSGDMRIRLSCAKDDIAELETAMDVLAVAVARVCAEGKAAEVRRLDTGS